MQPNLSFVLKTYPDAADVAAISQLEKRCLVAEPVSFKLELDYKRAAAQTPDAGDQSLRLNEFFCYDGTELVGYLGLGCFDGVTGEINGMVHPAYRRRGIFRKLMQLVLDECRRLQLKKILLLTDKRSEAGIALVAHFGARPEHEEHEMEHVCVSDIAPTLNTGCILMRKATNADIAELMRLDTSAFGAEGARELQPEIEEARGMTIFLAQLDGVTIGKVNLQLIQGIGGIYGLCVHPDYQGRGYGRELLMQSCSWLKANGATMIHLQVVTVNDNALHLYESCGFNTVATMAYYEVE